MNKISISLLLLSVLMSGTILCMQGPTYTIHTSIGDLKGSLKDITAAFDSGELKECVLGYNRARREVNKELKSLKEIDDKEAWNQTQQKWMDRLGISLGILLGVTVAGYVGYRVYDFFNKPTTQKQADKDHTLEDRSND